MWGGLKGAVPILLGTLALLRGVPDARRIYDIVFVVVAFSVVVQGDDSSRRAQTRRADALRRRGAAQGELVIASLVLAAASLLAPTATGIVVTNGSTPFAGDGPLLATVSPNGDGFRDRAIVRFRLDEPARVRLDAVVTQQAGEQGSTHVVWTSTKRFPRGLARLVWRPAPTTSPRTYILRLTLTGSRGASRVYDNVPGRRRQAPVVRVQGIDAGFTQRSYAPGELAKLVVSSDASSPARRCSPTQAAPSPPRNATCGRAVPPSPAQSRSTGARIATLPPRCRSPVPEIGAAGCTSCDSSRRRPRGLRAVRRAPAAARRAPHRCRARDAHVAGVQLRGRERRRLGRHLVCQRRPRAPST